jgi:hypothetical protein
MPLTLTCLKAASKAMSKGKAPGFDRLGIKLYKACSFLLEGVLIM